MCMACEEMQLYYAYLDAIEEARRKAQPWQCEVHGDRAGAMRRDGRRRAAARRRARKAGFACDEPE